MSPDQRNPTRVPTTKRSPGTWYRAAVSPLSLLYGCGARWRARRWRGKARRLPHPVCSVGNLTFGGTGKTPFVVHACRELIARGKQPAILSRGYGGNDEGRVLERWLPGVPQGVDPDRFAAGNRLADQVDCYVLDDGFQHLPLARDSDIVLVDATAPFGSGWCPPGGRLREPIRGLGRADLVVITRADLVSRESLGDTMRTIRAHATAPVVTGRFRPSLDGDWTGRDVFAACGIGNPDAFHRTIEQLGARVAGRRVFKDHHAYTVADAAALAAVELPVLVTEKDAVKLEPLWPGARELHVVRIEFEPMDGAEALAAVFDALCE